jgi:hypothetical protein
MMHLRGERRRAVALASLLSFAVYVLAVGLASLGNLPVGQNFARLLAQPVWLQLALIAPVWFGAWLFALAQRQLIAQDEGAYSALLAVSHTRGMGGPGLLMSALVLLLLAGGYLLNILTPALFITGLLGALYLGALGLPNAPASRYDFRPPGTPYYPPDNGPPAQALPPAPARGRIIDANR